MGDLPSFGQFSDPIVGGQSILIRDAIKSRNYDPGTAGWTINADGSAEFADVEIRGSGIFGDNPGQHVELSSAGEILIYDTADDLVMFLDGTQLLIQDTGTGSSIMVQIFSGQATMELDPPDITPDVNAALIYADSDDVADDAWLYMESPEIDSGETARLVVYGENASISAPTQINVVASLVNLGGPFAVGRGPVALASSSSDSAAVTAETVVLTATSFDYEDGRAYRATVGPLVSSNVASARALFRLRKTNTAGALLGYSGELPHSATSGALCNGEATFYFRNDSGGAVTASIVLTLENAAGGGNTSQQRVTGGLSRWLLIEDCGPSDAFPYASALT